jgi:ribosomal protein L21E
MPTCKITSFLYETRFFQVMVQRIGGFRSRTRHLLKKNYRSRGKISIKRYLQTFEIGTRVRLKVEPAVHEGMYFPRYHNKAGTIKSKKGRCYEVEIKDLNKTKSLVIHPAHLTSLQ